MGDAADQIRRADFEAAVKKCNAELARDPHNASVLRRRGEARRKLGQHREAVADLTAALAFQPGFALALAGRGAARRSLGEHEEALRDFDTALKLDPLNALVLLDRAAARHSLGRSGAALEDLDASLRVRPQSVPALQLRGEVRRKLGKLAEAVADFDAALRLDPRHVPALAGRGAARRALGLREEAIADYDAALVLAPGRPSVLAGRGAAKLELRMAESARADFEAALERDKANEFARWGLHAAVQQLATAGLQVTLTGFESEDLNTKFAERRRPGFAANGMSTYWSLDGRFFLYWCEKENRWKGSRWTDLEKVQRGSSSGFIAAPPGADIRAPALLLKGWHEWTGKAWAVRKHAGVSRVVALEVNIQTLTLAGFAKPELNVKFAERFRPRFMVNGRETYWSGDGKHFLYWCQPEARWKGTLAGDLPRISAGRCSGFIGAPAGADILSPALVQGWHEWDGAAWLLREAAGVAAVASLAVAQKAVQAPPHGDASSRARPAASDARPEKMARLAKAAAKLLPSANGRPPAPVLLEPARVVPKVPVFAEGAGGAEEEWT